jgi:Nif-specific regulatory protein
VIARAVHELSARSRACSAHQLRLAVGRHSENSCSATSGAFTTRTSRSAVLELADGGTVFLDEINEMGLHVQPKLLRVLERREFRRVGGTKKIKVDLRIIAASNVDLDAEVRMRRFREDLYYRLKVITLVMPPLRDRREDIPELARYFLRRLRKNDRRPADFSERALARLRNSRPGNVRS